MESKDAEILLVDIHSEKSPDIPGDAGLILSTRQANTPLILSPSRITAAPNFTARPIPESKFVPLTPSILNIFRFPWIFEVQINQQSLSMYLQSGAIVTPLEWLHVQQSSFSQSMVQIFTYLILAVFVLVLGSKKKENESFVSYLAHSTFIDASVTFSVVFVAITSVLEGVGILVASVGRLNKFMPLLLKMGLPSLSDESILLITVVLGVLSNVHVTLLEVLGATILLKLLWKVMGAFRLSCCTPQDEWLLFARVCNPHGTFTQANSIIRFLKEDLHFISPNKFLYTADVYVVTRNLSSFENEDVTKLLKLLMVWHDKNMEEIRKNLSCILLFNVFFFIWPFVWAIKTTVACICECQELRRQRREDQEAVEESLYRISEMFEDEDRRDCWSFCNRQ